MSKLERWRELSAKLKEIKKEEMDLRRELCGNLLEGYDLPATRKVQAQGVEVVAKCTLSFSVDNAVLQQILPQLDSAEKAAIDWKPNLRMKNYKALPENSILHEAVVSKPAAPTLTVTNIEDV